MISLSPGEMAALLSKVGIPCRFEPQEVTDLSTTIVVDVPVPAIVFPAPVNNASLTLRNLRDRFGTDPARPPSIFDHEWYAREPFMETVVRPGWRIVGLDVLPESINETVNYIHLISNNFQIPAAVEMVLGLFSLFGGLSMIRFAIELIELEASNPPLLKVVNIYQFFVLLIIISIAGQVWSHKVNELRAPVSSENKLFGLLAPFFLFYHVLHLLTGYKDE